MKHSFLYIMKTMTLTNITRNIFFILFIVCTSTTFSQISVKGGIITLEKQPVEFAEIYLQESNINWYETSTDSLGNFNLQLKIPGTYTLIVAYLGEEQLSKEISITSDLDLGKIIIEETTVLNNMVIEAKRKQIEKKVDRLIFNVSSSIQSSGSDAIELLKITPRVKVENDKISMIGKSSMRIMIDDRPVQFSDNDLTNFLRSIRSDEIQSIEVITIPPAKYIAEGNSGIINIITKKKKEEAWNTSLQTTYRQGNHPIGIVGGNFNYIKNKFKLSYNTNYYKGSIAPVNNSLIEYPTILWKENNKRRDFYDSFSNGLAVDYEFSKKISMGLNYRYNKNGLELRSDLNSNIINSISQVTDSLIKTPSLQFNNTDLHTFNYHFIYKIDTLNRKLSFDFDYFNYASDSNRNFSSTTYQTNNLNTPISFYAANNIGDQKINNLSFNLDMEHPLKWVNLNYGVRFSNIETKSGFKYYDVTHGFPEFDTKQSNNFIYKENTQAIYFSAQKELSDKWETKIGLRLENTNTQGNSLTLNEEHKIDYIKLFPTAYLSFTPNEDHTFSLSYSRRINRPNYSLLNPFRWVASAYSYSEGNPYLQPAFTNNLELEYMLKEKFISSVYFSHTDDDFEQLSIINPETSIQQIIPKNFIINRMIGFNQTIILKPLSWWNINFFGTVYYSSTDSKVPVTLQYLKGWNGEFSINNDFTLNKLNTLFLNISYSYVTKGVDNLDYNSAYNQLNTSFKGLFFDKRLIFSLHVNDILSSSRITYTGYSNGLKTVFKNYFDNRYLTLSLTYNFGKNFKKERRDMKNDEELNRTN